MPSAVARSLRRARDRCSAGSGAGGPRPRRSAAGRSRRRRPSGPRAGARRSASGPSSSRIWGSSSSRRAAAVGLDVVSRLASARRPWPTPCGIDCAIASATADHADRLDADAGRDLVVGADRELRAAPARTSRRRWRRTRAEHSSTGRPPRASACSTCSAQRVDAAPGARVGSIARYSPSAVCTIASATSCSIAGSSAIARSAPLGVEVRRDDRAAERLAGVLGEQRRVAREARLVADRLDDRAEVADRDALAQQRLQHALDLAEREHVGHDLLDDGGVGLLELVEQLARLLAGEQLGGVRADRLGQVRDDRPTRASTTV